MNLLKLLIPSGSAKSVVEVESWTVKWTTSVDYYGKKTNYKCFTSEEDAKTFIDALVNAKVLLNTWVEEITYYKN